MLVGHTRSLFTLLTTSFLFSSTYAQTAQGCYKDDESLTSLGTYQYQSEGYCSNQCKALGNSVFAMSNGSQCSCGNSLPSGGMVDSSFCSTTCVGYPSDICGGTGYYSVWLTGTGSVVAGSGSSASASSAAGGDNTLVTSKKTTSTQMTVAAVTSVVYLVTSVVQQGVTVVQTVSAATTASRASSAAASSSASLKTTSSGGGISGGAIAGIVIGVLAAIAIGVAAIFLYRRKKNDTDEFAGEYKRHIEPAGAGMVRAPEPSPDTRLDTSMAIRRNSSESLADNQDYSRKILRVIN